VWPHLQVRRHSPGLPLPLQARRRDGMAPPGAAGAPRGHGPPSDQEPEGPRHSRAHPQGAPAPHEAQRAHANHMGPYGSLQRRGGGQGCDAALPDPEPKVQGRREGGPDHPGRVHRGTAPGGKVHRHHAQGKGDEDTV